MRIGELEAVYSLTPAYASKWKERRVLLRLGASADYFWNPPGMDNQLVGRMVAGVDALLHPGRYELRTYLRWRPNFGRFWDDWGVEAGLAGVVLFSGPGWVRSGQRYEAGLELGYAYWKVPSLSYGPDWLVLDNHTLFARLVVTGALASLTPPQY
jgi:hypothetical protein